MVAALLTGVYSIMVEPTQTNLVTETRTTYSEITYVRTTATIVGTVTTYFISTAYECQSGYEFYSSIDLLEMPDNYQFTRYNVCISWYLLTCTEAGCGGPFADIRELEGRQLSVSTSIFSSSLTTNTTTLSLPVYFPVTLTERVPNPQKSSLQNLAVVLFIAGVGGIAAAIILRRPRVSTSTMERDQKEFGIDVTEV
jgi:hypothetical protein